MNQLIHSIFKSRRTINLNYYFINNYIQEIKILTKRLFIQTIRRPASTISSIIQPLLWLFLFGGLFHNIPLNLFNTNYKYEQFLSCGIIVFTAFTGSLNAGLPLIFDREFGFLNRLLVSPIVSRNSIILSATSFIICITMIQSIAIISCCLQFFQFELSLYTLGLICLITLLITSSISNISLGLAFILPGHIEFLAFIFIINLPMLFASTALAPSYLMPYWLQIITKFNPLTYAIESIRLIALNKNHYFSTTIIHINYLELNLKHIISIFISINFLSFITIKNIVSYRLE